MSEGRDSEDRIGKLAEAIRNGDASIGQNERGCMVTRPWRIEWGVPTDREWARAYALALDTAQARAEEAEARLARVLAAHDAYEAAQERDGDLDAAVDALGQFATAIAEARDTVPLGLHDTLPVYTDEGCILVDPERMQAALARADQLALCTENVVSLGPHHPLRLAHRAAAEYRAARAALNPNPTPEDEG